MDVSLMDSSVRDGGNVNDWNFGKGTINGILTNLINSRIEYIELGYLKNCEYDEDKTLYNTVEEAKRNIPNHCSRDTEFSLMVQEDKWNWDNLEKCDGIIKNIRVSFHKTDIKEGMELCKRVMEAGYTCHCNPINIMGYTDKELIELVEQINILKPAVFTIVDTFGSMSIDDIQRINCLLNSNLNKKIKISVHLHENIGLAFALAIEFISYFWGKRDIIVDASLYGIGRIPGNLCIELIARYLNNERGKNYCIDYLYDAVDDYITEIKKSNPWGYELAYALSAFYNLHRTYPEFLIQKGRLKTKDIRCILERIVPEHRVIYDREYIEKLYREYMNVAVDDSESIAKFKRITNEKHVVLIAPGASIKKYKNDIIHKAREKDAFIISVNFVVDFIDPDCVFYTSTKRFAQRKNDDKITYIAVTSNLRDYFDGKQMVFDYNNITSYGQDMICEDSVLMVIHLLSECNPKTISVAGFDYIMGENRHYDISMEIGESKPDIENRKDIFERFQSLNIELMNHSIN